MLYVQLEDAKSVPVAQGGAVEGVLLWRRTGQVLEGGHLGTWTFQYDSG